MTRNGHTTRIVECPHCGHREVLCLPTSQVGHECKKARGGWAWLKPVEQEASA